MNRSAVLNQTSLWLLVGVGLAACALPWVIHPGASISLGAYDLAEWTSLMPAVRDANLPLLPTLLLRLPLVCLAGIVAWSTANRGLRGLFIVLAALALLPPLQFFSNTGDINYRQQFTLALLAFIIGAVGFVVRLERRRAVVAVGFGLVGALAAIIGSIQAYTLMGDYQLPTQLGVGGVLFAVTCAGLALKQTR
ncbi:MAG: hypothetical protein K8I30_22650 [Anaerolineae bacterium]|nr:hypothetical protein [Anaerolineae bacterium]